MSIVHIFMPEIAETVVEMDVVQALGICQGLMEQMELGVLKSPHRISPF